MLLCDLAGFWWRGVLLRLQFLFVDNWFDSDILALVNHAVLKTKQECACHLIWTQAQEWESRKAQSEVSTKIYSHNLEGDYFIWWERLGR